MFSMNNFSLPESYCCILGNRGEDKNYLDLQLLVMGGEGLFIIIINVMGILPPHRASAQHPENNLFII